MGWVLVVLIILAFLAVVAMFGFGIAGAVSAAFGQLQLASAFEAMALVCGIVAAVLIVMALLVGWAMGGQSSSSSAGQALAAAFGPRDGAGGGRFKPPFASRGKKRCRCCCRCCCDRGRGMREENGELLLMLQDGTRMLDEMIADARAQLKDAEAAGAASADALKEGIFATRRAVETRLKELEAVREAWSSATGITRSVFRPEATATAGDDESVPDRGV